MLRFLNVLFQFGGSEMPIISAGAIVSVLTGMAWQTAFSLRNSPRVAGKQELQAARYEQ